MDIRKYLCDENEKPLDRMVTDGGFVGIFRTIAVVGDSLSSGEFECKLPDRTLFMDMFDYSWGQYIARAAGCKVYNFSRGGMTAKEYCEVFAAQQSMWDTAKAAQAYIIALGANDLFGLRQPVGDMSDVCLDDYTKNTDNFAGRYCEVIQRYKQISPDAKFFLLTMLSEGGDPEKDEHERLLYSHGQLMHKIAASFTNCYVLDMYKYMPVQSQEYKDNFYLHGHLNPCGYVFTAQAVMSYIDYIIRHNMKDFRRVAFINTPYADSNPVAR
ncbi:MAG: SGNH/GDSL hydrolase family protein [Clostridia bacterium]|nr:SGNH/GDSL hydrolase family protein [Clostridia bacterium]